MSRSRPRWSLIALTAAVLAGATVGFLGWSRSQRLAEDHALRAQRALDEMRIQYANVELCLESLKKARRPSDKTSIEAIMKSSRHKLVKLEEAAIRHERLAREYGYTAPFKRPKSDSNP
jgi:hypothetical protein